MNPAPAKRATGTQAVDRAADLLVQVLNADSPVTFSHLTTTSGLAKGTASRLISALERKGLLQRNNQGFNLLAYFSTLANPSPSITGNSAVKTCSLVLVINSSNWDI